VNVKKWLTRAEHEKLLAEVEAQLEADRDFAVASPMPEPESAIGRPYCDPECHEIKPKYAVPKVRQETTSLSKRRDAAVHLK
jgi:TPP-dependent pyruvate/acetoin dehydrogenase alpha subunit